VRKPKPVELVVVERAPRQGTKTDANVYTIPMVVQANREKAYTRVRRGNLLETFTQEELAEREARRSLRDPKYRVTGEEFKEEIEETPSIDTNILDDNHWRSLRDPLTEGRNLPPSPATGQSDRSVEEGDNLAPLPPPAEALADLEALRNGTGNYENMHPQLRQRLLEIKEGEAVAV